MPRKRIDKSEECKICETCKIDCLTKHKGELYRNCEYHDVFPQEYRSTNLRDPKYKVGLYFDRRARPWLGAHFCLEHNMFHCLLHQQYCIRIYGASVMTWRPTTQKELAERARNYDEKINKETCKLYAWSDQVEFGLIKCAECGKSICECDPEDFEEKEPRLRITIPCEKCAHAIKLKRTRSQILELRTIQCGSCRNRMWFQKEDRERMLLNISSSSSKSAQRL